MRKKIKFFLIFFGSIIFAQSPICQITDFSPAVKGISFGPEKVSSEHCYFWINSPAAGEIQIACYSANVIIPIHNEIDLIQSIGFSGSWAFSDGIMSWIIKPGEFHLVGASSIDNIEVKEDETF